MAEVSEQLQLTVVYEDGDDGWVVASVPVVPGAMSQGRIRAEARENVINALALMLSPEPDAPASEDREALHFTLVA